MRVAIDPYLRLLAAAALVVVVTGTVLDLSWLPLLVPAVGVLFAVGGAVAAAATDRAASARASVGRALTTLLLPFWLFAVAVVATMLTLGWSAAPFQGAEPFSWSTVWLWLFPISEPPASVEGTPWVLTAAFVPAYLWLTLATPALLWLVRRWPLRLLAVPVLTVLLLTAGIVTLTGRARDVVLAVCVLGCCWGVGLARSAGTLPRVRPLVALAAGGALLGSGLALALWRDVYPAGTVDDSPLTALLCSLGAVLLLLRVPWRGDRLRGGWPGTVVSAVGARTMTVFLWAPAAAAAAVPALALSPLAAYHTDDASGALLHYATTWLLILVVVLLVGWAEDVGAGLWPTLLGGRRHERRRAAELERTFVVRDNLVQGLPPAPLGPASEPAAASLRR
ncbi:hypothetical protein FHU33_4587 [Blastococcus colisei]|uniref:Acyltransferase 3 domain-containing protein n=1 Tax=Blastococcus colisei TaxID=1564162 RepID=A0A543P1B9_9ACTN|nr:acyltransferase family protein [Blastococcus colisei]TQN37914.1 hypothetical protein FHU33_4587 [Blastococcus colisei]